MKMWLSFHSSSQVMADRFTLLSIPLPHYSIPSSLHLQFVLSPPSSSSSPSPNVFVLSMVCKEGFFYYTTNYC